MGKHIRLNKRFNVGDKVIINPTIHMNCVSIWDNLIRNTPGFLHTVPNDLVKVKSAMESKTVLTINKIYLYNGMGSSRITVDGITKDHPGKNRYVLETELISGYEYDANHHINFQQGELIKI